MSDFDKEAERERLREKYEAETEDRESTQRMSELLLKGATMTNSHCGTCGDPIFRYDGTEFCPTCNTQGERADAGEGARAVDADTGAGDARTEDETRSASTPSSASDALAASDAATGDDDRAAGEREPSRSRASAPTAPADDTGAADRSVDPTSEPVEPSTEAVQSTTRTVADDAVANVEATLQRFAAAANDTDDPERARECLQVVRDAADTLRALRSDGR